MTPSVRIFYPSKFTHFFKQKTKTTTTRKHAKSRTTAENIAYRTNQLPVGAQDFAPTACNPTIIAHFKLENRSMSCTFQLICIASLLAFSTFILVFMQNCRDCRFSNSEMTPMLPFNTRYDNAPGPLWPSNFQAKMLLFKVDFASAWYTIMHFKQKTHRIKP